MLPLEPVLQQEEEEAEKEAEDINFHLPNTGKVCLQLKGRLKGPKHNNRNYPSQRQENELSALQRRLDKPSPYALNGHKWK